jgi:hypothetical protein
MIKSDFARQMLRELVQEHRDGIKSGNISYGTAQDNQDALDTLDELDALTDTKRVSV